MVTLILVQLKPNILVVIHTNNTFIPDNTVELLEIIDINIITLEKIEKVSKLGILPKDVFFY